MREADILSYLRPARSSFWKWGDDGTVLQWSDDRTIAFLPEVHAAVLRLTASGLPPFGALALALAAMRDGWATGNSPRGPLSNYVRSALAGGQELPSILTELLRDACVRLDALATLPADLRKGPEARALLVEMLFEGVPPAIQRAACPPILSILSQRIPDFEESTAPASAQAADALAILRALAAGRTISDAEAVRVRQQTGLEQTPSTPEIHVSDVVRSLLDQLRGDPELSTLAALARSVLAVIAAPRRLRPESELPLGGLSDISNRGPLDRLLLTELAHDDLTLAVRVALNEALYLRRESPRAPQSFTRAVVLDSGIRLWGLPRVFAAAVALALAATTPKEANLLVWRAVGKSLEPVDLTTRAGLLAHLAAILPDPHPAAALPALSACLEQLPKGDHETILVTHPDVADDADFQRALQSADLYPILLASVEHTGQLSLDSWSATGRKPIAEAQLDLDELMTPRKNPSSLIAANLDLPAYFSLALSPFRFPTTAVTKNAVFSPELGLFTIDSRQAVHWAEPGRCRSFSTPIPAGTLVGFGIQDEGKIAYAVTWSAPDKALHLWTVHLKTEQIQQWRLDASSVEPYTVASLPGSFLLFYKGRVDAFSVKRGRRFASLEFPDSFRLLGGRYLMRLDGSTVAVTPGPASIDLVDVTLPSSPLAVFDRIGSDGPFGLYADGSIVSSLGATPVGPQFLSLKLLRHSCRVSHDGSRLVAAIPSETGTAAQGIDLHLPNPHWQELGRTTPDLFVLGIGADYSVNRRLQLRRVMHAIGVNDQGDLTLISRRNKLLIIRSAIPRFESGGAAGSISIIKRRPFERPTGGALPVAIDVARWSDGSQAWMDPRGMLHLRSSNDSIPELTLLLADNGGPLNAWCADDTCTGAPHLLTSTPTLRQTKLGELLRAFVGALE